jgi:tRNA 2-thiouridine synthesizing protein A
LKLNNTITERKDIMANLEGITPNKVVDARSMACPGPLLEAKKAIGGVSVGQTLEIQSGDKGSREDISAWCKKTGQEFLGFIEKDGYDSLYVIRRK